MRCWIMKNDLMATFNSLKDALKTNADKNNHEIATLMSEMANFSYSYFMHDGNSGLSWYSFRYKNSMLEKTPFEHFSQNIKNKIFKKFLYWVNIKGYISLKILELLCDEFEFHYTLDLDGNGYKKSFNQSFSLGEYRCYASFDESKFIEHITSKEYAKLLVKALPQFIEEYNSTYDTHETISYKEIDFIFQYLDTNDTPSLIKYIYSFPLAYNELNKKEGLLDKQILLRLLNSFKCSCVKKQKNKKELEDVFKDIIKNNFYNDKDLFYTIVHTPKLSHLSLYFSSDLINEMKEDIHSAVVCYKNICSVYEGEMKSMLGKKVMKSNEFKYIFG